MNININLETGDFSYSANEREYQRINVIAKKEHKDDSFVALELLAAGILARVPLDSTLLICNMAISRIKEEDKEIV